jgi:ribonuclease P protein component
MFAKKNRLAKTKDVESTITQGRAFFNSIFRLKVVFKTLGDSRFTVVVSTKVAKNASVRNRLKRIVREFIKKHLKSLRKGDYVVGLKPGAAKTEEAQVLKSLENLLKISKLF